MLEIEIDGKQIQVPDGSTVMEAADKVGAYIPHFCYHKKLSIAANCRMCLVHVEKAPKPLPACATPVTNGMKVWTHSEQAVKAQKGVMEFLLINHPLDCPICDQGGECQLQDLSVGYGGVASRYEEEKRVVSNKDLGPLVSTDMTRCINCTRCVRFTTEIAGLMELGQAFRGEHAEIMPFVEKTVDTELSGNIIDLCPVGALTSKPFRFGARAWEMSRRKSISPHDSLGANLIVQVKNDVVKRVLPLENESVNECWLSDKDRFSYPALNADDRVTKPMIKQGGVWIETDWASALDYVTNGLKSVRSEFGAESIGALVSPHSTLEELYLLNKLVRGVGSENIDHRLRHADFALDSYRAGAPWLGMSLADIGEIDRLLVVGSFFRKDHPLVAQRVRQAAKKGLRVSSINSASDDWQMLVENDVVVPPSRIVEILGGVIKALVRCGERAVSQHLIEFTNDLEVSTEATGIADSLASGRNVAIWIGNFALQHLEASKIHVLVQEIARLTGGRFGVLGEAANSVGAYQVGAVPKGNGLDAYRMLSTPRKAYILFGVDPGFDFFDDRMAMASFAQAQTVIVMSAFASTEMMEFADVILPVSPFTETAGTYVNCEGRAQSFYAVVKPQGDSRPAWKVLKVLGDLFALDGFAYENIDDIRKDVLDSDGGVIGSRLDNHVEAFHFSVDRDELSQSASSVERVADIPIYSADMISRRSTFLAATKDGADPVAKMNRAQADILGLSGVDRIKVKSDSGEIILGFDIDERVADGCLRLAGAHALTSGLGALQGKLAVERV